MKQMKQMTGWWFQIFFIFIPTWGNDPILLISFKWVGKNQQPDEELERSHLKLGSFEQKLVAKLGRPDRLTMGFWCHLATA